MLGFDLASGWLTPGEPRAQHLHPANAGECKELHGLAATFPAEVGPGVRAGQGATVTSAQETQRDANGGPVMVLADDDEDARSLIAHRARAAGFRIYEASTGRALISCVRRLLAGGEEIGVVLSDVNMPECDGIAATKELLGINASLRVILMTAVASAAVVQRALQAGAKAVLCKPIAVSSVVALVSTVAR